MCDHGVSCHPQDVLRGAADEVLGVLKAKDMKDPQKQVGCPFFFF